jgi:NAD(P)-dependent dehydrogenase (short-subunit alcohol dehydrogenase family)
MEQTAKMALVTGANRGMGLETCRQLARLGYQVILTSREETSGKQAVQSLAQHGRTVLYQRLDVANPESVKQVLRTIQAEIGDIEVLVNNAAVHPDEGSSVLEVELDTFHATMDTNFFGPLALCQAFVPGMIRRGYGRVVNVSSGAGQLSMMGDFAPSYSASKAALNALTCMMADAAHDFTELHLLMSQICQLHLFPGCPAQLETPLERNQLPVEEAVQERHF